MRGGESPQASPPSERRCPGIKKPAGKAPAGRSESRQKGLAERDETLRQARQFPRRGVLVEDALGDAARQLRLDPLQRVRCRLLVAAVERRLDLLDEGADAADPRTIDLGPARIAADSLLCLRRIRHLLKPLSLK